MEPLDDDINWKNLFYRVGRELYSSLIEERTEFRKEAGTREDFESEHAYITHQHNDPFIRELRGREAIAKRSWDIWVGQDPDPDATFRITLDKELGYYAEPE